MRQYNLFGKPETKEGKYTSKIQAPVYEPKNKTMKKKDKSNIGNLEWGPAKLSDIKFVAIAGKLLKVGKDFTFNKKTRCITFKKPLSE